jgi:hypothetical protein
MASDSDDAKVREYIRLLENPYASVQVRDVSEVDLATSSIPATASPDRALLQAAGRIPTQVDLFSPAHPPRAGLVDAPSGNPYAAVANIEDEEEHSIVAASDSGNASQELSKSAFESGCRRIFSQYIPLLERGRLRPEHRDYIARNVSRSAKIRYRLLKELRRYDLSDLSGMQPQFNREDDRLTAKKLLEIEQAVVEGE